MGVIGIIPARMGSTRFPNKPLVKINGIPMIGHVYHRARLCKNLFDLYVATCDDEIIEYIISLGGKAVLTKNSHERATERIIEASSIISEKFDIQHDGVLMIQGDEPLINPKMLDEMISFHQGQSKPFVTNLVAIISDKNEFKNKNVVKVVKSINGKIMYMSRSSIPSDLFYKKPFSMFKQLGLILFSKEALVAYERLKSTALEKIESIDMNRFLENDFEIISYVSKETSYAVDTKEDLQIIEKLLFKDPFIKNYKK